jgi:putative transposase
MTRTTTKPQVSQSRSDTVHLFEGWFDPIEAEVRPRAGEFIEEPIPGELDAALARPRYGRGHMTGDEKSTGISGYRHGQRTRSRTGTFGPIK